MKARPTHSPLSRSSDGVGETLNRCRGRLALKPRGERRSSLPTFRKERVRCDSHLNCASCMMKLFVPIMLALALPPSWLSANATNSAVDPYWIEIDLSKTQQPCRVIQNALNNHVTKQEESASTRIRIRGSTTISESNLQDRGDYLLCFGLIPTNTIQAGSPVGDASGVSENVRLTIHFEDVDIAYAPQKRGATAVIAQWGNFYQRGWASNNVKSKKIDGWIQGGVRITGRLSITSRPTVREARPPRLMRGLSAMPLNPSKISTIGWFETGLLRADLSDLSLNLAGSRSDPDDIGLIHHHGWGVYRGPMRVTGWGVGLLFYGNSVGSIVNAYVSRNNVGLALGDARVGGDVVVSPRCLLGEEQSDLRHCERRAGAVSELTIRDSVVEGNSDGNLVIFHADRISFDSVHFEMAKTNSQKGHGILLGGGVCAEHDSAEGQFCGSDSDCRAGRCAALPNASLGTIRFLGGSIGGDRSSDDWDAVFLGPGVKPLRKNSSIRFETRVGKSDTNRRKDLASSCGSPGVRCEPFGFHQDAKMIVDLTGADSDLHVDSLTRYRFLYGRPELQDGENESTKW